MSHERCIKLKQPDIDSYEINQEISTTNSKKFLSGFWMLILYIFYD